MFEKLANIFRVPDLRKRVLFTLALLAVYRLGGHIPTPGINPDALRKLRTAERRILGFFDLFAGGNLRRLTIFALGIMPYITASIILQLLTVVVPDAREAAEGRRTRPAQDHPVDPLPDDRAFASCSRFGIAQRAADVRRAASSSIPASASS